MARQRKFIIVKDRNGKNAKLRIGYPFYHRDLLTKDDDKNNRNCYGGGQWDIDFKNKKIRLYGKSDDFGAPSKKDIEEAIKNFDSHDYFMLSWTCERVYITRDTPQHAFDNMEKYTFDIEY